MYVETVPNRLATLPLAILLREGRREGRPKEGPQTHPGQATHWPKDKIAPGACSKDFAQRLTPVPRLYAVKRSNWPIPSMPHGLTTSRCLLEAMRRLKLPALIDPRPSPKRDRVLAMILQRLLYPASKLATKSEPVAHHHLRPRNYSLEDTVTRTISLMALRADDATPPTCDASVIATRPAARLWCSSPTAPGLEGDPVLYDVSSSYYEGQTCP